MMITAVVGYLAGPVKFCPDSLEATFVLAEGQNRYLVRSVGNDPYDILRLAERTGEQLFVTGIGATEYRRSARAHMFRIDASLVIPAAQVDRNATEQMVERVMKTRMLFLVDQAQRNEVAA